MAFIFFVEFMVRIGAAMIADVLAAVAMSAVGIKCDSPIWYIGLFVAGMIGIYLGGVLVG